MDAIISGVLVFPNYNNGLEKRGLTEKEGWYFQEGGNPSCDDARRPFRVLHILGLVAEGNIEEALGLFDRDAGAWAAAMMLSPTVMSTVRERPRHEAHNWAIMRIDEGEEAANKHAHTIGMCMEMEG